MTVTTSSTVKIFVSYSTEDNKHCTELKKHLKALKGVSTWYDQDLIAGDEWNKEIYEHLDSANLIIFLTSPDFFNSKYCPLEMERALEREERGSVEVIPIIIRGRAAFLHSDLGRLQALPKGKKTLAEFSDMESAFNGIVEGICGTVEKIRESLPEENPSRQDDDGELLTGRAAPLSSGKIHTFCGLHRDLEPLQDEDNDVLFQDFIVRDEGSRLNNPICYFWADARGGNYIKADVFDNASDDPGAKGLEIEFWNDPDTWASNVAIFPQDLRARRRTSRQIELRFDAEEVDVDEEQRAIAIEVRVVDELLRHWCYRTDKLHHRMTRFVLPRGRQRPCYMDLNNPDLWDLFLSDGNRTSLDARPQFELIPFIVLIVGRDTDTELEGHGKVRISNIRFGSGRKAK